MRKYRYGVLAVMAMVSVSLHAESSRVVLMSDPKQPIIVTAHNPIFKLRLKANPTTGYSWLLCDPVPDLIVQISQTYRKTIGPRPLMGAGGYEEWAFRAHPRAFKSKHTVYMEFVYARPWEKMGHVKRVNFKIIIQPEQQKNKAPVLKPPLKIGH